MKTTDKSNTQESELKHAPGPWHIDTQNEDGLVFIKPIPGQIICEVDPTPEQEANCNLISAAPELLKGLTDLLNHIYNVAEEMEGLEAFEGFDYDIIEYCESAINKATGKE
jgi:hypothetical protein